MFYENKKDILVQLKVLLNMTRAGMEIKEMVLSEDGNFVSIVWKDGYRKKVCVEADSGIALVRDVMNAI